MSAWCGVRPGKAMAALVAAGTSVATLVALLVVVTVARADVAVTIAPLTPVHPVVNSAAEEEQGRSDDPDPSFLVESNGENLTCQLDQSVVSCGTPYAPCPARSTCTVLAASGLSNGRHAFMASAEDQATNSFSSVEYILDVDLTPPGTDVLGGVVQAGSDALHPVIGVDPWEDDPYARDSMQCFIAAPGQPEVWQQCTWVDDMVAFPGALPNRHIDYRVGVRAVDDFGRVDPIPWTGAYDPVPCAVSAPRTITLSQLAHRGIPVRATCSYTHDVEIRVTLPGKKYALALHQQFWIKHVIVHDPAQHYVIRRTLHLDPGAQSELGHLLPINFGVEAITWDTSGNSSQVPLRVDVLRGHRKVV